MTKLNLEKYAALEAAKEKRARLLEEHAAQLLEVDEEISREYVKLGLPAPRPTGAKQSGISSAKQKYWDELKAEAIAKGWYRTTGRRIGEPDLDRVRLARRAEEAGVSVATYTKREQEERAKRAAERVKGHKSK
jgi:hypothetical protein